MPNFPYGFIASLNGMATWIYLIIAGAIFAISIIMFITSEKYRREAILAKKTAEQMKKMNNLYVSQDYDIETSNQNIEHNNYLEVQNIAKREWPLTIVSIVTATLLIFVATFIVALLDTSWTAMKHGCTIDEVFLFSPNGLSENITTSPVEDKLPENLSGKTIIYFRFGCPDCSATYNELSQLLKNIPDVYWISTRSKQGKSLRESYPVKEVPSGVYIKYNGAWISQKLYKDVDNQSVLDSNALQQLLNARYEDSQTHG